MKKVLLIGTMLLLSIIGFGQEFYSNDCDLVKKEVDEFSEEITFEAKITGDGYYEDDVSFYKYKTKSGVITYYLSIWIKSSGIYRGNGVTIILKNGKKINKPNQEVESTYTASSFYTKAFIRLTNQDIELFKQSGIWKYKLYVETGEITDNSDFSIHFNCLVKAK